MGQVSTIGLDIAKSVFQVHGVDVDGVVVIRKRVSRAKVLEFFAGLPSCLIPSSRTVQLVGRIVAVPHFSEVCTINTSGLISGRTGPS